MEKYKKLSKLDFLKSNFFGIMSFLIIMTWWTYAMWPWSWDVVSKWQWELLRNTVRWNPSLADMWCTNTITVWSYEVCASNAYRYADYFYNNDMAWMILAWHWWLYTRATAIKTDWTWPCSNWYHLPTKSEWDAIINDWKWIWQWWIADSLWLKLSGYRRTSGSFAIQGSYGYYWSSTESSSTYARYQHFHSSYELSSTISKNSGFAVRCIKD